MASAASLRTEINSMNHMIAKVMMKKDIEGFRKIVKGSITSDFTYTENGQSMNFDKMVDGMKQGFASLSKVTAVSSSIVSLKQTTNSATATMKHSMSGIMIDEKKKSHKMVFTGTSVDTYRKVNGKWKMSSMNWKASKMMMDGKEVPMPKGNG